MLVDGQLPQISYYQKNRTLLGTFAFGPKPFFRIRFAAPALLAQVDWLRLRSIDSCQMLTSLATIRQTTHLFASEIVCAMTVACGTQPIVQLQKKHCYHYFSCLLATLTTCYA